MKSEDILKLAENILNDNKASSIVIIDIQEKQTMFDHLIIANGTSSRHLVALKEKIYEEFKKAGIKNLKSEGEDTANWVIIDAGTLLIHLFKEEVRDYYNIEDIWDNTKDDSSK